MPDWALSLMVSLASLIVTAGGIGIAWGVLSERVAGIKEQVDKKASLESVEAIRALLADLRSDVHAMRADLHRLIRSGEE